MPDLSALLILALPGAIVAATVVAMLLDRNAARLATRNIGRRRVTTVLIVLGLMMGAAMISGSLAMGDTSRTQLVNQAVSNLGNVDEEVYRLAPQGGYSFFDYSVYSSLRSSILDNRSVIGVTPAVLTLVSVLDANSGVGQPQVALVGVSPNATSVLGNFLAKNGSPIDPNLEEDGAVVNYQAARDLNASVGDILRVFFNGTGTSVRLMAIDFGEARSGFPDGEDHVVVTLQTAELISGSAGRINFVAITNGGGPDSAGYTAQVGARANSTLTSASPQGAQLAAYGVKNSTLTAAIRSSQGVSSLFVSLSGYVIGTGIILIVNIFVMLADERKRELGVSRALGMKRRGLIKTFLFEGFYYSILASAAGAAAGVGIGYAMVYVFGGYIAGGAGTSRSPGANSLLSSFTVAPTSLLTAFAGGFLITYVTALISSWRISKLNVIRAIREIPEPPPSRRTYSSLSVLGSAMIGAGAIAAYEGYVLKSADLFIIAPEIAFIGFGFASAKLIGHRASFTVSSIVALVYWGYAPLSLSNPVLKPPPYDLGVTILFPFFMVLASVLIAILNLDILVRVINWLGGTRWLATFRVGLAYPSHRKFRTSGLLLMFALILFLIVGVGIFFSVFNAGVNKATPGITGGYEMLVSTAQPVSDLGAKIRGDLNASSVAASAVVPLSGGYVGAEDPAAGGQRFYVLYLTADAAAPPQSSFFYNHFNVTASVGGFVLPTGEVNASAVWNDLKSGTGDVVIARPIFGNGGYAGKIKVGDVVSVGFPDGTSKNLTVVASVTWPGPISLVGAAEQSPTSSSLALVSMKAGADAQEASIILKRDFLSYGMQVLVFSNLLDQFLASSNGQASLFQSFFGFGMVVGIAGLSIMAFRSTVERKRDIGVLRALGFTRRKLFGAFFVENSMVALLGIVIGTLLAISLSVSVVRTFLPAAAPSIPYAELLGIDVFTYILALASVAWPLAKSSSVPPAEALRYVE